MQKKPTSHFLGITAASHTRSTELGSSLDHSFQDDSRSSDSSIVLSIAGSDSGSGAGIQADLKTCQVLGCYGATAITAVTAQNTRTISSVYPLSQDALIDQIKNDIAQL